MKLAMLRATMAVVAAGLPLQDIGVWQVLFTGPGEMLIALETAEFRGSDRPTLYVHCKDGVPRVFLKPAPDILRMQFDEEPLFRGRFVTQSFGFRTDEDGNLVEQMIDTDVPPLKGLENPEGIVRSLQEHDRLYVRIGRGAERNHFELAGFALIVQTLQHPC